MKDIYDWIVSTENSNLLRENYLPSFEEKVQLVCGALSPVEEQYEALTALSAEAKTQDDKELIDGLLRLYDWAFKELLEYNPGQIFIFKEYRDRTFSRRYAPKPMVWTHCSIHTMNSRHTSTNMVSSIVTASFV